jgi:phosphoribosylformimino-5-aminoimidazole carboxamide ribotide isomerase
MEIIPAIDLLGGACVRLRQGGYDSARRYAGDPAVVARVFERAGARRIHLVDLDAARGEGANNRETIRRIRQAVGCHLEVGGGIRTEQDLRELEAAGAERLVLGTVLVRHPEQVAAWTGFCRCELWAGIDALEGRVRVAGWAEEGGLGDRELAVRARELGLNGIVYTSIVRDGTLEGPDIEGTNRVAAACGLPVILSGGIGGGEDVESVFRRRAPGVQGLIVGRALYEGRVDLANLFRLYPPTG